MMKMKTKIMLTSIIFMLLALPLEAKEVYIAVLHDGIVPEDQRHWDDLDAIIKANSNNIDHYFQAGDYTLDADREFIIRGGRSSIAVELEKYKTRNIITDKYHATTKLHAYGCYVKRPI